MTEVIVIGGSTSKGFGFVELGSHKQYLAASHQQFLWHTTNLQPQHQIVHKITMIMNP